MNETCSQQSSKQTTPPDQSLISQDSWIVRRGSEELFKDYQTAQTNLNSAGPGTSHEEWNKLRMATGRALRALQEGDKYGWEALVSGGLTLRVSCASGTEPISGKCYETKAEADSTKSDATVKP